MRKTLIFSKGCWDLDWFVIKEKNSDDYINSGVTLYDRRLNCWYAINHSFIYQILSWIHLLIELPFFLLCSSVSMPSFLSLSSYGSFLGFLTIRLALCCILWIVFLSPLSDVGLSNFSAEFLAIKINNKNKKQRWTKLYFFVFVLITISSANAGCKSSRCEVTKKYFKIF